MDEQDEWDETPRWQDGDEATAWDLVGDDTWLDLGLKAYLLPRGRVGWEAADPTRSLNLIRLQRLEIRDQWPVARSIWVKPEQRVKLVRG